MPLSASGLRREALVLVLLLASCQAAFLFLSSQRGLRFFAGEVLATLENLAAEPAAGGPLTLAAAGSEPTIAKLGPVELAPGRTHLVTVRAGAGLTFGMQSTAAGSRRPDWSRQVPRRAETEAFTYRLPSGAGETSRRFEIWNTRPYDLAIHELRIEVLAPAHDRARGLLRPLALVLIGLFAFRHRRLLRLHLRPSVAGPTAAASRTLDALIALVFLLACLHVYLQAPGQQRIDSRYTTAVSQRLLTAGTPRLPEDFSPAAVEELPYQLLPVEGGFVHLYPNAPAVLNAPIVALFSALGLAPLAPHGVFLDHREHQILTFAAAVEAAALCALLFLLARIYLSPPASLALASVFAFGTQIFSTVSRSYWSHAWALLLLAAGLLPLLEPRWRRRSGAYVASASLLSWSFFCRPPMSLSILAITALVLLRRRRHFPVFALTGAAWAALLIIYSRRVFDAILPPYFLSAYVESGTLATETLRWNYPRALVDTLFSADRGLFVFVPFVPLLLVLVVRYWRQLPDRTLAVVSLAAALGHWQLVCTNRAWSSGGFGPRLLTDVVVWLYVLAILVALAWRRDPGFGRTGRALVAGTAVLLVSAAILVNARGATAGGPAAWDGYTIWDWRRESFLGRVPPPPAVRTFAESARQLDTEPDAAARERLLRALVSDGALVGRPIDGSGMIAYAVTWDHWTYGANPGFIYVSNPHSTVARPRLGLATWAPPRTYPITVTVADGEAERRHVLSRRGEVAIDLAPVAPGTTRVYVVRSDKSWIPRGPDGRELGVQLRAVPAAEG